ncbi:hypothetical protein Tco_0262585 [Tanacetum coccineum]
MPPKRTAITTTTTPMTDAAIKALIAQGVADALAGYKATRNSGNGDENHESRSGVIGLTQWLKKMESVFHISNCTVANQDVAYGMTWKTLKKMMTDKYYPRGEIKKLEIKLWNLKVKGNVPGLPCEVQAQIHRIFLDGYGALDVRTVIFKCLRLSSRMLIWIKPKIIIVRIKRLLDDLRVTVAQLMLLVQKLLLLVLKVNAAGISYYYGKITTAGRVYADREKIKDLSEKE